MNTVAENKKDFTKHQVQRAKVARALCQKLGFPSMKDFKWIVMSNQIKDCPVAIADIKLAVKIWDNAKRQDCQEAASASHPGHDPNTERVHQASQGWSHCQWTSFSSIRHHSFPC